MKLSSEKIKSILPKISRFVGRYSLIIFLIIFASMSGFLVIRIGELSRSEPSQEQIDERLQNIKAPKVDQTAIDSLKSLQDRNISISSLFDNGRNNPFEN